MEGRILLAVNPIVAENQLPGTPQSVWGVSGGGDTTLQGFATDISVNHGKTISFKINDQAKAPYHIDIYRLGYYQGNGARLITTISASQTLDQVQPTPLSDPSTGLVDAGNWAVSASWAVPATATSGLYIARLARNDTGGASVIYFVVRADDSHSAILFQTSDTTWEAYNTWGGSSLYQNGNYLSGGGVEVSYNRPLSVDATTGGDGDYNSPMHGEYPMIRFLEQNGYDLSYFTDVDSARNGNLILNHQIFMSVGHDEYWSQEQRNSVTAARDAGVNIAFFSGNECFWKTRWLPSIDGSNTNYRTLVTYKETTNGPIDPSGIWTGTWRDGRYSPPQTGGGQPENALSGTMYMNDRTTNDLGVSLNVPYSDANMRFWRNTAVAKLQPGQTATLGQYVVGYEVDEDLNNGFRPAGLMDMSSTTFTTSNHVLVPWGNQVGGGVGVNSTTLYRAASGALVFSAGSIQWSWGLDGNHNDTPTTPDPSMQQATINILADMKVQPGTLMAGMVAATASTDLTPPTSRITSPLSGAFTDGIPVTITGTASDSGGGVVAGVEVSTDGGQTWQPATGRNSWSFTWIPSAPGNVVIETRAVDDSANLETPSDAETVKVSFTTTSTTGLVAAFNFDQGSGSTLTDLSGKGNNGTINNATWTTQGHTGDALSFTGSNSLVSIPNASSLNLTTGMTLEAWIDPANVTTPSPVIFKEGSTSPFSLYSTDTNSLHQHVPTAYASINGGMVPQSYTVNDVTANTWTFVAATFNGSALTLYINGQAVCSTTATSNTLLTNSGALDIGGDTTDHEFFQGLIDNVRVYNRALNQPEIQADMGTPVGGTLDAVPPTGSITAPANNSTVSGTTTVTASASDNVGIAGVQFLLNGAPLGNEIFVAPYSFAWNTLNNANGSYSLSARVRDMAGNVITTSAETITVNNGSSTIPTVVSTAPTDGATGVSTSATVSATFNETVQQNTITFNLTGPSGAVPATLSYNATTNTATLTPNAALTAGSVYTATISGATDSGGHVMNTTSWAFTTAGTSTAPTVVSTSPPSAATGVSTSTAVSATFNEAVQQSTIVFTLTGPSGTVPATLSYSAASNTATLTPNAPLAANTVYTANLSGATDSTGAVMSPVSWIFTTANSLTGATLWPLSSVPANPSIVDPNPVELGVKFTSDTGGYITGIDFYKGSLNTGTHVAHLWTSTGTLLATATFTSESATGWQQVNFSSPVAITANTTYVASYFAPSGGYADDTGYFATNYDNAPLHAPSDSSAGGNGVYVYGGSGSFPTTPFSASNYWVTPVFSANVSTSGPTVVSTSPTSGATGVATSASVSATFNEAVQQNTITFTLTGPSGSVPATLSYNATTFTATLTPNAALAAGAVYTATISGATDSGGKIMPPLSWTFTTAASSITPTVVSISPASGATGVATSASVSATFNEAVQQSTITFTLTGPSGAVPATFSYNATTNTATITPNAALASGTVYTAAVSGATDSGGLVMSPTSWSFTTAASSITPTVVSTSPASGATGVATSTAVSATFNEAVQQSTIVFTLTGPSGAVPATLSYNATTSTATLTPNAALAAGTTYTAQVSGATDSSGKTMSPTSWTFTTLTSLTNATIWPSTATPAVASTTDGKPIEVGVKLTSDLSGYITGMRFYKGTTNTGTHVAHLWTASGTLLATATFTSETASGWQQVNFASPVAIAAGTTYVASYYSPNGYFAITSNYFATTGQDNAPLHAPSSPSAGGNGVYTEPSSGSFPTTTTNASNYWVDVVFSTTVSTVPTVVSTSPASGAISVATSATVSATFNEAVQQSTIVFTLTGPSGSVPATLTYNATTFTATLTPNAALAAGAVYTATISGATDSGGHVMTLTSWTFTTASSTKVLTASLPSDFNGGTFSGTAISNPTTGGIQLASNLRDDFTSSSLSSIWTKTAWSSSSSDTLSGGILSVAANEITAKSLVASDTGVEGSITFSSSYQHFGMATDLAAYSGNCWAIFSTMGTTSTLYARVNVNGATTDVKLGTLPSGFHTYKVLPVSTGFAFYVDGTLKTTIAATLPAGVTLNPILSDFNGSSKSPLKADWVRVVGGTYVSSAFDAGQTTTWLSASWTATLPTGTTVVVQTSSSTDGVNWSSWAAVSNGGSIASPAGRYFKYRILLTSPDSISTAVLSSISFTYA